LDRNALTGRGVEAGRGKFGLTTTCTVSAFVRHHANISPIRGLLHILSVVHYNSGNRAHLTPRQTFSNHMNAFSVKFLRHEQASYGTPERFFYHVTVAGDLARLFTVWIDAGQESVWGTGVRRMESGLVVPAKRQSKSGAEPAAINYPPMAGRTLSISARFESDSSPCPDEHSSGSNKVAMAQVPAICQRQI